MSDQEFANFEVDMDMTEVQPWGGEDRPLVPPGDYNLTVTHLEQKPIGNNTPAVVVTFEVVDAEDASLNGSKIWCNYPLTTKALGRLKAFMVAGGGNLSKFNAEEYLGVVIRGTVIHNEGKAGIDANGEPRPAKMFANLINERPLEGVSVESKTVEPPPMLKNKTAKPANGTARRA